MAKTVILATLCTGIVFGQAKSHSVTLTWDDLDNPAGTVYNIYRADKRCDQTPIFSRIATGVPVKTYIDTPIQVGNFCYTATAYQNDVESEYAIPVTALVRPFPPSGAKTDTK